MKKVLIFLFVIGLLFIGSVEFIEEFFQNDTAESDFQNDTSDDGGMSPCGGGKGVGIDGIPGTISDGGTIPCGSGKGGGEGGVPG